MLENAFARLGVAAELQLSASIGIMLYNKDTFQSPDEVYRFVEALVPKLRENGYDPEPLESVQQSAYTTSSEWLGELGSAVRKIERQNIRDEILQSSLQRIMKLVNSIWPTL